MNLDILMEELEAEKDLPYLKTMEKTFHMEDREKYQFWCHVLERSSPLIEMFHAIVDLGQLDYIMQDITTHSDNALFARALRKTAIPTSKLKFIHELNNIIVNRSREMPDTIELLFNRAEVEKQYAYLLTLGSNKNKKDLLRSILKSQDHELIDKFFFIYKDYPEVKHLTIFL